MAGPGDIVTHHLAGGLTDEHATGTVDLLHEIPGILHSQIEVFRPVHVREFHGFVNVFCDHRAAAVLQRNVEYGRAGEIGVVFPFQPGGDLFLYFFRHGA